MKASSEWTGVKWHQNTDSDRLFSRNWSSLSLLFFGQGEVSFSSIACNLGAGLDINFISYLPCRASRRKLHLIQKLFALVVVDEGCQNSSSQSVWFWHTDQSQSVSLIGHWECVHLWLFCSFLVCRLNKVNQLNATHSFIMEKGSRKILFKQTSLTLRWNMLHVSFTSSLGSSAVCLCCVFLQRCWSELKSFDWLVDSWTVFIILCVIIFCDIS